jgi:Zn-finger nucleic acid-binding protein
MLCPRCSTELQEAEISNERLHVCPGCRGSLILQRLLIPVLTALSRELAREIDLDTPIDPVEDVGANVRCPRCGGLMENFGYMGTDLVHFDRCERCEAIWSDAGELGGAALLFARTNLRRDALVARAREEFRERSSRLDSIQIAGAMSRLLFRVLR